jgi:protoheme IX farnesyltransferase
VQGGEGAERVPPLGREVVVLPRVVPATHGRRDHRSTLAHCRTVGTPVALLRAAHPVPAAAVTVVAAALAVSSGRDAAGVLAVAAAVLAGQLSIGWDNDAVDADRDRRTGRRDKPVVAGVVGAPALRRAAWGAAASCVPLSLLSGWAGLLHVAAVASAWLYNRPLKSTPVSVLPFVVSFGLLPAFVLRGTAPWWLVAAGSLLGAGAHFANVLPDLADDAATGVRGLPHRLGYRGSALAAGALLLAASVCLAVGPTGRLHGAGIAALAAAVTALAAAVVLGRRPGSRAPFRAVLVVALVDVLLLVVTGAGG